MVTPSIVERVPKPSLTSVRLPVIVDGFAGTDASVSIPAPSASTPVPLPCTVSPPKMCTCAPKRTLMPTVLFSRRNVVPALTIPDTPPRSRCSSPRRGDSEPGRDGDLGRPRRQSAGADGRRGGETGSRPPTRRKRLANDFIRALPSVEQVVLGEIVAGVLESRGFRVERRASTTGLTLPGGLGPAISAPLGCSRRREERRRAGRGSRWLPRRD
jgi:hypothetical protein